MTKKKKNALRLPNGFLYGLGARGILPYLKIKYKFTRDITALTGVEPPYLFLCNHASGMDYMPTVAGMYPQKLNIVTAQHYFYDQPLKTLLPWLGAIPKQQFQVDVASIKKMKQAVALGGAIALFPEGQVSVDGQLGYVHPSLAKLAQFLGVPIVIGKLEGTGACKPKWAKVWRRGPVRFSVRPLLSAEQVKAMSREELYRVLVDALSFDEVRAIRENGWHYKGKQLAKGLENALYQCPRCGAVFGTVSVDDKLSCKQCGNTVYIDDQLQLHPLRGSDVCLPTVAAWLDWQKQQLESQMEQSGFCLEQTVVMKDPRDEGSGFVVQGRGTLTFSTEGMRYQGGIGGAEGERVFPVEHLQMIPYACGVDMEIPYNGRICVFEPDNKQAVQQWILFSELLRERAEKTEG